MFLFNTCCTLSVAAFDNNISSFFDAFSFCATRLVVLASYFVHIIVQYLQDAAGGNVDYVSGDISLSEVYFLPTQNFPECLQFIDACDNAPCGLGSCRISPPRFLAECGRSPLNQGSFVLLYFVLFNFSGLYLVSVACHLSF